MFLMKFISTVLFSWLEIGMCDHQPLIDLQAALLVCSALNPQSGQPFICALISALQKRQLFRALTVYTQTAFFFIYFFYSM